MYDLLLGKLVVDKMRALGGEVQPGAADAGHGAGAGRPRRSPSTPTPTRSASRTWPSSRSTSRTPRSSRSSWRSSATGCPRASKARPGGGQQSAGGGLRRPRRSTWTTSPARLTTPASPRMLAKQVLADKTEIPSTLFGNSKMEVTNLSDAPQAAKLPITMQIKSYVTPALLKVDRGLLQGRHAGDLRDVRGLRPEQAAGALAGCGPRVPVRPGLRNVQRHVDQGEGGPDDRPEPQGPPGPGDRQGRAGPRGRADDPGHAGAQGAEHDDPGRGLADRSPGWSSTPRA